MVALQTFSSISNKFQYNLRGLSTGSLRLVRVDLVAEREVTEGGDLEEDLEWHEAAAEEILEGKVHRAPVPAGGGSSAARPFQLWKIFPLCLQCCKSRKVAMLWIATR